MLCLGFPRRNTLNYLLSCWKKLQCASNRFLSVIYCWFQQFVSKSWGFFISREPTPPANLHANWRCTLIASYWRKQVTEENERTPDVDFIERTNNFCAFIFSTITTVEGVETATTLLTRHSNVSIVVIITVITVKVHNEESYLQRSAVYGHFTDLHFHPTGLLIIICYQQMLPSCTRLVSPPPTSNTHIYAMGIKIFIFFY